MISDTSLNTGITVFGGVITVVVPALLAYLIRRQEINHQALLTTAQETRELVRADIEVVRKDVNGKMAQLLKTTGEAERAKGNLEGHAEAIAEKPDRTTGLG